MEKWTRTLSGGSGGMLPKSAAFVEEMIGGVLQTAQEHLPLHELKRQTWARLSAMGHEVLALLFARVGPGDVGRIVKRILGLKQYVDSLLA